MIAMSSTASHQSQGSLHLQCKAVLYRLGMTIGTRIKKARKEKGLSLEALGSKIGVSRQLVWQWEKDETDPSKHVEALSKHLNVPLEYFYGVKREPDELALKIALLSEEQQELIQTMIDKMLGQTEPKIERKASVK